MYTSLKNVSLYLCFSSLSNELGGINHINSKYNLLFHKTISNTKELSKYVQK